MRTLLAAFLLLLAIGCQHAKPKASGPIVEEYNLPPDEPRFNNAPQPIGPGGPHFIVGGRNANESPSVVRPGGTMPFTGP
jgi:hypothetical protein